MSRLMVGLAVAVSLLIPVGFIWRNLFRFPPRDSSIKCPTDFPEMKLDISNVF